MKRFLVSLSLSAVILLAAGQLFGQTQQQDSKTAGQQFKNIKVLKGIPADELIPSMQFIASSLGVQCEFCHVRGAFEKDDKKPKQTARSMIEMEMAINRDNFKGQTAVTCFSCHRGAENPVGIPIISDEAAKPREVETAEKTAPTLPSADEILSKYLQAVGGSAAVEKVTSRQESGTVSFGGRQFPVEVLAKAPNKRISIVHMQNGENITAYDGQKGWLASPGPRPPRDMNPQESEATSFDAALHLPAELNKMFAQLRVRPAESIDGHDVVQVIGMNQGKPPVLLFFDKQSGLLLRSIRYEQTPLGRNPTQVDYADYKDEGGVKIPLQWTVARPAGRFTIQISKVEQNVPISDSKFEKPAAKQGQQKSGGE
ncbi:MAG TPA: c-type cytochrome [Candidatus Angelobacter sp.]|nr:c-type cytochrome [Candidatus Angelobacter sp.]